MARAYICLARNDLPDNMLALQDLKPHSSQRNSVYDGAGQTGVVTHFRQNDTVVTTAPGGVVTTSALYRGLAAYLWDNVEDVGAGPDEVVLTDAAANEIADTILNRLDLGLSLTAADITTLINAHADVSASDLTGVVADSNSRGLVEEILRILAGEVYELPAGSVSGAAGIFPNAARQGAFVTTPNVGLSDTFTVDGALNKPGGMRSGGALPVVRPAGTEVGANGATGPAAVLRDTATLAAGQSLAFRNVRRIEDVGALHASALNGALSRIALNTFVWLNPGQTYGAGGTALTAEGNAIAATGAHRACSVYQADGTLIV